MHIFAIAQDGTLTAKSTLAIGEDATSVKQVLVSPDGTSVVITGELGRSENYNTYGVILYARASDGSLTQLQAVEGFGDIANYNCTTLSEVRYESFSADGKQLYLMGILNYGTPEGNIVFDLIPSSETFTERGDAVALIPSGTLSAPVNDQSSYQGATLVIERTGGAQAGDRLGLSAGSGLTLAEDGKISLGDKAIANATTDANGKLTLTFLAGVTQAEAQQVLRAITYQSTSNDPTAAGTEATFRIHFNDGQDHTAEFTTVVNLVGINDPAVVSTEPVNSTYVPGNDAITLFKNTVIDTIETGQKIHRVEISVSPTSVGDVLHVEWGRFCSTRPSTIRLLLVKAELNTASVSATALPP